MLLSRIHEESWAWRLKLRAAALGQHGKHRGAAAPLSAGG
jgi:hypothetical protein